MLSKLGVTVAAGLALSAMVPQIAEASFANALGKKKHSAKVASNPSTATQQLTADPVNVVSGTTSVGYDPIFFSLYTQTGESYSLTNSALVVPSPGFHIDNVLIGVSDGESSTPFFMGIGDFLDTGSERPETGEIRVTFSRTSEAVSPVILAPQPGYSPYVTSPDYEQGDDTFGVIFYERTFARAASLSDSMAAAAEAVQEPFTVFTAEGKTITMIPDGQTEPITYDSDDVEPATVTVPEPASLGLLFAGGLTMIARRRRR